LASHDQHGTWFIFASDAKYRLQTWVDAAWAKEAYTVLSVASTGCFHQVQRIFLQVGHFGYNGSEYSGANFVREKELGGRNGK